MPGELSSLTLIRDLEEALCLLILQTQLNVLGRKKQYNLKQFRELRNIMKLKSI